LFCLLLFSIPHSHPLACRLGERTIHLHPDVLNAPGFVDPLRVRTVDGSRSASAATKIPTTTVRLRHRTAVGDLPVRFSRSGLRRTTDHAVHQLCSQTTAATTPKVTDAIIIGIERQHLSQRELAAADSSLHETQLNCVDRTREVNSKSVANKTISPSDAGGKPSRSVRPARAPSRSVRRERAPSTLKVPTSPSVSADPTRETEFDYRLSSWSRQTTCNSPKFENRDIGRAL
jgi:hypothetical protein